MRLHSPARSRVRTGEGASVRARVCLCVCVRVFCFALTRQDKADATSGSFSSSSMTLHSTRQHGQPAPSGGGRGAAGLHRRISRVPPPWPLAPPPLHHPTAGAPSWLRHLPTPALHSHRRNTTKISPITSTQPTKFVRSQNLSFEFCTLKNNPPLPLSWMSEA